MNANNSFIVRAAESGDAAGLAKVHIAAWKESYKGIMPDSVLDGQTYEKSMQGWIKRLAPGSGQKNFVALDGIEIIGFSGGGNAREKIGDFDGEMYAIYLLKKYHHMGLGRLLTKYFAEWLLENNYRGMYLWVLENNPTRHYYESIGGVLLPGRKIQTFGGKELTEIAYGWQDLKKLV
jgi:GNAT superfamily N-acetyltransferase